MTTGEAPAFTIRIVPVTPFQQNCSLVRTKSGAAAIIDPGGEADKLIDAAREFDAQIEQVWLTHGHLDHAGAAIEIKRRTGAPIIGPQEEDSFWLDQIEAHGRQYGWTEGENCAPDRWLHDGDILTLDGVEFGVTFTPGHTPGHVVIYNSDAKIAFVGDVIFSGSIGRTDFPRGDKATLIRSITEKLWPLGDDMRFVPGHGPVSTFGQERRTNPFVSDAALR